MGKAEDLAERQRLQAELVKLSVTQSKDDYLTRMAEFLNNLATLWEAADQENRNRLAADLFEAVWVDNRIIQGVTPNPELIPFFDMVHGEAVQESVQWRLRREAINQVCVILFVSGLGG